jgi:5-methyltetrahydropteroyltriglutamate--homocysteine methyltransferase
MPTYRSEVIGSLLRPEYLKQARRQRQDQALDAAAFKRVEDRAVDEAVDLQSDAGLDVITDG